MNSFWSETRIDYLNIGLMLLSLLLAFVLPFELFLFAYAVLGPLHYVTEIGWLDTHQYFVGKRWWAVLCVATAVVVTVGAWLSHPAVDRFGLVAVFFPFFLALIVILLQKHTRWQLAAAAVLVAVSIYIIVADIELLLFTLFIPTILHVFMFTLLFMLFGALKRNRRSGYASVVVLCLCAVAILAFGSWGSLPEVSNSVRQALMEFSALNIALIEGVLAFTFHAFDGSVGQALFESTPGLLVMRFVAFAYTYHYLNWFSKTSIIGWHKVQRWKLALVLAVWVIAVSIYAVDYALGFKVLLFLSFLHVLLEFPLNHQSFIGVGQQIASRISSKKS